MEKPLKVKLHILSPVHIGCDDVYEPTSFVIDERTNTLIEFEPMDFVKTLNYEQKNELIKVYSDDNLLSIFKFIKRAYKSAIGGRKVSISSGLSAHYKKVLAIASYDKKTVIQQFTINKTTYNPQNNIPYIPGSSIKGSMRTAYLSKLAKDRNITGRTDKAKDLEHDLLYGSFDKDPFRMVKVSDFMPAGDVKVKIIYAVNRKKRNGVVSTMADNGPPQILEIIQSDSIFEGIINIQQPEKIAGIARTIRKEEFLKSMNAFYMPLFEGENKVTKEINAGSIVGNRINEKFKHKLGLTAFILRIGRHSGAESVTVEGNRYIKIIQKNRQPPKFLNHATTFWLASESSKPNTNSGLVPFGWVVMEIL
ncbi:MAG: CRISPR-associated protein, Csm5 family [Candidatus Jettenia ecosi]|uniref:CRISPR system Cms protein Csm5 n=1 Tax=Candidatus Jettenia ecosi TaxID=2494326 RepID=A0A533QAR3_9BACT|nr:MAG: CRISPR-associated protein, Csm5 family [Candidatus Jettenia ecosi]